MEFKVVDIGYQPPVKKKILVVDDELALQSLFYDTFSDYYDVISAHTGNEGMKRAEFAQPDLIFMDIMLPDRNGYDVVKLLRANPETQKIPVIIITARDFDPSTIQVFKSESNVAGFLSKPFRVAELRGLVDSVLQGKK